jgi:anion-transporting  ArsA/GET3 family ATPase
MTLDQIVASRRIVVCVGSGGVGKTTTAAALALHAARRGRRTLVMTIDPARRLANSLGLAGLDHTHRKVADATLAEAGVQAGGELWAMMLDAKQAFDEMVGRHSPSSQVRDQVLSNRIYQYLSTRLPGSQEYMAMDQLHAIHASGKYDLIVLDTPPTANALDFLEAPDKLVGAIDSAAIRWFLKPFEKGSSSFSFNLLNRGSAYLLKALSKFTGAGLLEEIAQFLLVFQALLTGFKDRAAATVALLRTDIVRFVLVTSPEPLTIDEAVFFHGKLREARMPFGGFVVNRVHRAFPEPAPVSDLMTQLADRPAVSSRLTPRRQRELAEDLAQNQAEQQALAAADGGSISRLLHEARAAKETLVAVPAMDTDVHDLSGLLNLTHHLFASSESAPRS